MAEEDIKTVLYALAGQGGCDGEPYDQIQQAADYIAELEKQIAELEKDNKRLDWLADKNNHIGNVMLPTQCVVDNLSSLRGAIDAAMEMDNE